MKHFPLEQLNSLATPFYYYDMECLESCVSTAIAAASSFDYSIHYAVKANHNLRILQFMKEKGLGVDCVSENELQEALNSGFPASKILLAGVGKTDREIELAIKNTIGAIHVESFEELEVINEIAHKMGEVAQVALRINPDVNAKTHPGITTGLNENKFGISSNRIEEVNRILSDNTNVKLIGLHFHIGSQIEDLSVFEELVGRVNEIWSEFESLGFSFSYLNLGGGLGIDYYNPDGKGTPFKAYFSLFKKHLRVGAKTKVHFELGRSLVGQCGSLISRVLYVKKGSNKEFLILDAGMTELIRPALYNSYHQIDNLSSVEEMQVYDIVGPVCESSDSFAQKRNVTRAKRNDLIAIRSAGAYGQVMSSNYNLRPSPKAIFSDQMFMNSSDLPIANDLVVA
jgi:diaminopimelate decarboxylase